MKLLLLLLGLLAIVQHAMGQEQKETVPILSLPGKLPTDQLDISAYTGLYRDTSGDTLPLSLIQTKAFRPFVYCATPQNSDH